MVPSLNRHRCTIISPYSESISTGEKTLPSRRVPGEVRFATLATSYRLERHSTDEYGHPNDGTGFSLGIQVHSSYEFHTLPSLNPDFAVDSVPRVQSTRIWFFSAAILDDLVKSQLYHTDGLWKKFDIRGVVSYATIRQYIWYGEWSRKTYNEVDRAFYESINSSVFRSTTP